MDHWLAPHSTTVVFVGSNTKFVGCVGLEVVDHGIRGGAGLVNPLPVSFSIADGVMPDSKTHWLVDKRFKSHLHTLVMASYNKSSNDTYKLVFCHHNSGQALNKGADVKFIKSTGTRL